MNHTPAPWHVGTNPGPIIYGPNGEQTVDMRETLLEKDEHLANMALILAAPRLKKALQNISNFAICQCDKKHGDRPDCAVLIAEQALQEISIK